MTDSPLWKPLQNSYDTSRKHLHQLAFFAVSPARMEAVGRMGLRPTPGGFGTPEFDGRVARVEGSLLVHEQSDGLATQRISTVREAAVFFGREYEEVWFEDFHDPLQPMDPDEDLSIDEVDSRLIGEWFAFGFDVLATLRSRATASDDASEPQIWPEHFDGANEIGDADAGQRASYGFSPGDDAHPEPYAYVAAWGEIDRSDPYWNDAAFNGSSISYQDLIGPGDPKAACLSFFMDAYRRLHA